jgi:hypothetical protein
MAVLMTLEVPGGTTAHYDRTRELLGPVREGQTPPGLIAHACGVTDDGLLIVDVWESTSLLDDFVQTRLKAALAGAEMPEATVHIAPVHELLFGSGKEPNVLILLETLGLTTEEYDGVTAKMPSHAGAGETHPSVMHAAATEPDEFRIAGLYDSEDTYKEFAQAQMAPAVDNPHHFVLRMWPVYDCVLAQPRTPA